MSFCGLVSTSRERTSRTIAAMSFCWLPMRLVSEPSPTPSPLRARAYASAVVAVERLEPGLERRGPPAFRGHVVRDAHGHAADRVDHLLEAGEVDDDEVVDGDAGVLLHRVDRARRRRRRCPPPLSQPVANAELNMPVVRAGGRRRSSCVHDGMSTRESRGIETSSTRDRSAEMCRTIVVSERMPATSPPMRGVLPVALVRAQDQDVDGLTGVGVVRVGSLLASAIGLTSAETSTLSMFAVELGADAAATAGAERDHGRRP